MGGIFQCLMTIFLCAHVCQSLLTDIISPFFHPAPQQPREIGSSLTLFTRNTSPSISDGRSFAIWTEIYFNYTDFNAQRPKTYFIVHGWLNTKKEDWISKMKDELLKKFDWSIFGRESIFNSANLYYYHCNRGTVENGVPSESTLVKEDANVFIVDWRSGARSRYPVAVSDTRVVGDEIAEFIKYAIKNYKLEPSRIHLIGHSLGAHIAGFAGSEVPGIGRITGLDPAKPEFEGRSEKNRLDKSDADFVDVFHTNSLIYGLFPPVGPNLINSCSHLKAHDYFTATINDCFIWATKIQRVPVFGPLLSLLTTPVSDCSQETCIAAGFPARSFKARGLFAANFDREYPFCDKSNAGRDKKILKKLLSDPVPPPA